jgi:hypothetical protein
MVKICNEGGNKHMPFYNVEYTIHEPDGNDSQLTWGPTEADSEDSAELIFSNANANQLSYITSIKVVEAKPAEEEHERPKFPKFPI